jgi:hypothetical protein
MVNFTLTTFFTTATFLRSLDLHESSFHQLETPEPIETVTVQVAAFESAESPEATQHFLSDISGCPFSQIETDEDLVPPPEISLSAPPPLAPQTNEPSTSRATASYQQSTPRIKKRKRIDESQNVEAGLVSALSTVSEVLEKRSEEKTQRG